MPVRIVQSRDNRRLAELRRALAQPPRSGAGPAGIEGPNLVAEALRSRVGLHAVFASREQDLDGLEIPARTEVLLVPERILGAALATESPQPVAALIEPPAWSWEDLDAVTPALLLVLAGVQDPGNLGTILRSAEAFGAGGVLTLPGTVSAWNPKAVRASAGSVLRLPVLALAGAGELGRLRASGVRILAACPGQGALPAPRADLAGPLALLIGNEGRGLEPHLAAAADGTLTIPCPGPVESLNAAVAASILLYEASRQRAAGRAAPPPRRRVS